MYIRKNPLIIAGTVKPSDEYVWYDGIIPDSKYLTWDDDKQQIVPDLERAQAELDAMIHLPKLDIRRALRAMGEEDKLNALLNASPIFKADWTDAQEIDMSDPMVSQALANADIDVDAVKRQILGIDK